MKFNICANCGNIIEKNMHTCKTCGTHYCENCNKQYGGTCSLCGRK